MLEPTKAIISIRNLRKNYGNHEVLKGIDLDIEPGKVIGYIGSNGAGKSTTVRILTGLDNAEDWANQNKGANFMNVIGAMVVAGIIGTLHYFLRDQYLYLGILAAVVLIITFFTFRKLQQKPWHKLKLAQ